MIAALKGQDKIPIFLFRPFRAREFFGGYVTQGGAEYRLPWAMIFRPYRPKKHLNIQNLQ